MGQGAGKRVAGDRRRELGRPVRAPAGSPSEELLERIVQALESGLISEDDVARLLDRDRS